MQSACLRLVASLAVHIQQQFSKIRFSGSLLGNTHVWPGGSALFSCRTLETDLFAVALAERLGWTHDSCPFSTLIAPSTNQLCS